jgi:hypothetical protein
MTITRTGGFAGLSEEASIYSDGRIIGTGGKVQRVGPAPAAAFAQSVTKVAAPLSRRVAIPHSLCADCFVYIFDIPSAQGEKMFLLEETLIMNPPGNESQDRKDVYAFLHKIFNQNPTQRRKKAGTR